jgi:hypothetical protein
MPALSRRRDLAFLMTPADQLLTGKFVLSGIKVPFRGYGCRGRGSMPSVQQRVAELASTTADLIARLRELEELRERVRKAEISARTLRRITNKVQRARPRTRSKPFSNRPRHRAS